MNSRTSLRFNRSRQTWRAHTIAINGVVAARLVEKGHAGSAEFRLRSSQRLAAMFAGWAVERESVVVDGVRVCFAEAGDAVVFREHGVVAFRNRSGVAHTCRLSNGMPFSVHEHRDFHFASPTPEHLHVFIKSRLRQSGTRFARMFYPGLTPWAKAPVA